MRVLNQRCHRQAKLSLASRKKHRQCSNMGHMMHLEWNPRCAIGDDRAQGNPLIVYQPAARPVADALVHSGAILIEADADENGRSNS